MVKRTEIEDDDATRWAKQGFDRLMSVQRPAVLTHLRLVRRQRPEASPEEVVRVLEQRYLAAVTTGGAAVGAAAVLPGVGTVAALAISGVETAGFLEASALFAQSIAEVHGIAVDDPERGSTLVMALMLGPSGANLVKQFAGEAAGTGPTRTAYWGELVTSRLPRQLLKRLTDRVRRNFLKRFATRQGASIVMRAIPFGIGAVVGGAGNHMAGRQVVNATRDAFGPPPPTFPDQITVGFRKAAPAAPAIDPAI
jgi:hypothetical protein